MTQIKVQVSNQIPCLSLNWSFALQFIVHSVSIPNQTPWNQRTAIHFAISALTLMIDGAPGLVRAARAVSSENTSLASGP